jgi:AraC-like DNA-binding protein
MIRATEPVTLSAHVLLRVVQFCARRGHDPERLCNEAGLSHALLLQKEARVPYVAVERLCQHAMAVVGDEHFGLHLAEDVGDAQHYDIGVLVLMASETLGAALERFARNTRYWGDGQRLDFVRDGDAMTIRSLFPAPKGPFRRQSEECALAEVVLGARALSGAPVQPRVVRFAHDAPRDQREHRRIFDCPLEFDAEHSEVSFDGAALATPMQNANATFLAVFERQVSDTLSRLPDPARASAAVRGTAQIALLRGGVTLEQAARQLGMSPRTLQRRLQAEGTSFVEIIDSMRHEMALAYLGRGLPLPEVAELLGYSETSAFHHAFRRWTGQSPAQFMAHAPKS